MLGNDTDIDGGPTAIVSATDPANGTVMLTGAAPSHTGLTYTARRRLLQHRRHRPDDTFTYS